MCVMSLEKGIQWGTFMYMHMHIQPMICLCFCMEAIVQSLLPYFAPKLPVCTCNALRKEVKRRCHTHVLASTLLQFNGWVCQLFNDRYVDWTVHATFCVLDEISGRGGRVAKPTKDWKF
ncbi:hypothetical protein EUGRSUZ_C03739 [Eucalyptus grandis]|uniref:Uncharacterized protein n=2 Tax=Eucalyptus grandis TaxID=71139 RepID=A0ACC3LJS2_EUCGR|nr:hypothetical protein EUGRSUZ_C03739 [Eucalyptus grandis]